jgi:hypothetical protein
MSLTPKTARSILRLQASGFLVLITAIWLVEILHLPHLLYGIVAEFSLSRVLIRMGVVLVIWLWVHRTTRRLLRRLHELEEFLLVCSWCRKLGHKGGWVTMEEYFGSELATGTSHGICPDCAEKQFSAHRKATRVPPAA